MAYEVRNPQVEAVLRELGRAIGRQIPAGHGFMLMIFEHGSQGGLFYICDSDRSDMIRVMREFIQKYEHN